MGKRHSLCRSGETRNPHYDAWTGIQRAGKDVSAEELSVARYLTSYLLYRKKDYVEAADLAESVALNQPKSAAAQNCAKIALSCHVLQYRDGAPDVRARHQQRAAKLIGFIIETWPNSQLADEAKRFAPLAKQAP